MPLEKWLAIAGPLPHPRSCNVRAGVAHDALARGWTIKISESRQEKRRFADGKVAPSRSLPCCTPSDPREWAVAVVVDAGADEAGKGAVARIAPKLVVASVQSVKITKYGLGI